MQTYTISRTAPVAAPPDRVYGIIADYRDGHPSILPPRYFTGLDVEAGGFGAGTRIRFGMRVLGATRTSRASVTEPQPGRVLVETVDDQGIVTTFTVEPRDGGRASEVTIATAMPARPGLAGRLERAFSRAFLRRVYDAELAQLARVAGG